MGNFLAVLVLGLKCLLFLGALEARVGSSIVIARGQGFHHMELGLRHGAWSPFWVVS